MPPSNWGSVAATLASVYGDLTFNATSGDRYLLDELACDMWQDVRPGPDRPNVPQEDGGLIEEGFVTGTRLNLKVRLWEDEEPACGADLTRMVDTLMKHAQSMVKAAWAGRYLWTPAGDDRRLLDYMQMRERVQFEWGEREVAASLRFLSPFPYAIDFTQTLTTITGSSVLNNVGNTTMFPVFKVYGPAATFTLSNDTTDLAIVYDDTLPGAAAIAGGDYVEIDTFRNTAYLNGDEDNMKPGIDVTLSDFWGLVPGNNVVSITTAPRVDVLWQAAWV